MSQEQRKAPARFTGYLDERDDVLAMDGGHFFRSRGAEVITPDTRCASCDLPCSMHNDPRPIRGMDYDE